jgi:glucosamine--fructose-6-phosphate aminotransferase (isomerizing)
MEPGLNTRTEILSQPIAWSAALDAVDERRQELEQVAEDNYPQVIFTGCGSTFYLSLAAAALYQELTGKPARAVPSGELLLNPQTVLSSGRALLVAVSRSGSTTETVRAVEQFQQAGRGPVIAITNYADQPLAGLADLPIIIPAGQEQSVAQTRSFASMYMAATALSALMAGRLDLRQSMRGLPAVGERLLGQYAALARELGENLSFDRYYFLGSGARYGLACETNLKMKEMTLTHSEPFHFLEFRHGPMSMVQESAVVVGMLSETNFRHEQAVLDEMRAKGGTIVGLAEMGAQVAFQSGVPESMRGVLYLPVLQLMAFYRALAKGLNPDQPHNLTAVVKLNL